MKNMFRVSLLCMSALMILAGCGGGSSGSQTQTAPQTQTPVASKATVRLFTQGTLPEGTQLAGIAVSIQLPAGVTVDTDSNGVPLSTVVSISGVAQTGVTTVGPVSYIAPVGSAPGKLEFTMAASNFGTGEFATLRFNVAAGSRAPVTADVTITPADQTLRPVTSLTVVAT